MKSWIAAACGRAATIMLAAMACAGPVQAQTVYRFSPVNQWGINLTAGYWNPIIDYVSAKSGIKLELKLGRTSADTTAYVLAREVEFAYTNHLFSPDREKLGWKVIGARNIPQIAGQIVVPADSPITDISQLEGADVAFPGREAVVSYKFNYAHLLASGVKVKVVFGGNHDGAFSQLFSGKVKAVGAVSALVAGYERREGKKFRVLWSSEPVHELALMVAPQVPKRDAQAITDAFIGMSADARGREIIRQASELVGLPPDAYFVRADASQYEAYRRFYQIAPAALY